ncbi:hypothetical protein DMH17_15845 [Raoultella planticola]|nr:hypothetical protein [Raoultella planticola]
MRFTPAVQVFCYVCRHSLLHGSPSPFVITLTSLDETDRFARRSPHFPLVLLFANPAYCVDTPDGKQESFQMVKSLLNAVNKMFSHDDVGKLLLRLAVGGLMLFHGLHKLVAGVDGISGMLVAKGLPGLSPMAYWWGGGCALSADSGDPTRPAALVLAFTMIVAWLMVGIGETGSLDKTGAWAMRVWSISLLARWRLPVLGRGVSRWWEIRSGDEELPDGCAYPAYSDSRRPGKR